MEKNEIQFDEPEYRMPTRQIQHNLFVDFLVKRGWVKDEKQATYILFGVVIFCVAVMLFVLGGDKDEPESLYNGINVNQEQFINR